MLRKVGLWLLGVVGAWLGWRLVLAVTWWGASGGGVLALILWARHRTLKQTFPYVPSLAAGALLAILTQ